MHHFVCLLLTTSITAKLIPHRDGQCTEELKDYTLNGDAWGYDKLDNINGWPTWTAFSEAAFPGAEAEDGAGYDVYRKVDHLDRGCSAAIMLDYTQEAYGSSPVPLAPGNVIVYAKDPGCYYARMPVSDIVQVHCLSHVPD